MIEKLKQYFTQSALTPEELRRVDEAVVHINSAGYDEWGLDPETIKVALSATRWLYRDYFRVETVGIENVPAGRVLVIANHGGQLPIDAAVVAMSLLLEAMPARIARGMVERWAPSLPFVSTFFARCGQVTGDQRTCRDMLEREQCVMVFPEGTGGSGKTIFHRYELQRFGTGFVRLALETRSPIVPVAVIGAEETYPSLYDFKWLAKKFRAPYIPVTPFFPFLGPLGMIPLPCRITLRYGKPIFFDANPDVSDAEVERMVETVKDSMRHEIQAGLKKREEKLFTGSGV
jgi:1-acyl-sn-glycerol-3-phosphate acyltransferase